MSVILEAKTGDMVIILQEFHASPAGEAFAWRTSRKFRVGQRVRYVSYSRDEHYANHPGLGWMVFFTANGQRFSATQTNFVTEECWQGLKEFFGKKFLANGKPRTKRKIAELPKNHRANASRNRTSNSTNKRRRSRQIREGHR